MRTCTSLIYIYTQMSIFIKFHAYMYICTTQYYCVTQDSRDVFCAAVAMVWMNSKRASGFFGATAQVMFFFVLAKANIGQQ